MESLKFVLQLDHGMLSYLSEQASQDKKSLDVGANLFIGNLDPVSTAYTFICCNILLAALRHASES